MRVNVYGMREGFGMPDELCIVVAHAVSRPEDYVHPLASINAEADDDEARRFSAR
jgi:hypothetical protein